MSTPCFVIAVACHGDERHLLSKGLDWAQRHGAETVVAHAHIRDALPAYRPKSEVIYTDLGEVDQEDMVEVGSPRNPGITDADALEAYVRDTLGRPLAAEELRCVVIDATDEEALLDLAKQAACLVLGHHPHGGIAHFFLRSVDERLLNHASCPVLILPER